MYLLLLLVGAIGFIAMTLLGLSHGFGGGQHSLGGHSGGGHSGLGNSAGSHSLGSGGAHSAGTCHAAAHAPGHALPGSHAGAQHHNGGQIRQAPHQGVASGRPIGLKLLMALSPLDVFSLALGAGATGILLAAFLPVKWLPWCAVLGALAFDFAIVKPIMGLMGRFVSRPSEGLEGEVAKVAHAVTGFDADGRGIVKLPLDGQLVQLLAILDAGEREKGVRVLKGDTVLVIDVDSARNQCRVSRELAPSLADDRATASMQAKS